MPDQQPRFAVPRGNCLATHPAAQRKRLLANNATTGQYRHLTGVLRMAGHSPMLETGDDRILRLITAENLTDFDGLSVVVEGNLTGLDRLQVEWIGRPAS